MTRHALRLDGFPRWPIFAGLNVLAAALAWGPELIERFGVFVDAAMDVFGEDQ